MSLKRLLSGCLKVWMCTGAWLLAGPVSDAFGQTLFVEVEGIRYRDELLVSEHQEILVSEEFWKDVLGISVLQYPDSHILMQGGRTRVLLEMDEAFMTVGQTRTPLSGAPRMVDGILYLPIEVAELAFGYELEGQKSLILGFRMTWEHREAISLQARKKMMIPERYDYRDVGRASAVKNQGDNGTCWSFASLTALETSGRPRWQNQYSADHMTLRNSFSLRQEEGGEYTMSMAYLLSRQGPVWESEDPYGDGFSPDGLKARVHVQEIQIPGAKDYDAIKEAVFLYGGVQSSLYTSMVNGDSQSVYYNKAEQAYCYIGSQPPNHEVVIVGWDDHYPKENFQIEVEGDGAFLCVNSWGEAFGDGGYFYVSYYDKYIGETNVVYTGIASTDEDSRLYQTDLCGWVGQIGYGREGAYGANVYTAESEELLEAVGFYATGANTSYEIYVDTNVEDGLSFAAGKLAARGNVKNSGYYTIAFDEAVALQPGQRFAVILHVTTPEAVHPLAIEYQADDATRYVDLSDGEGYISAQGVLWESVEAKHGCNLCLKAYTKVMNQMGQ